MDLRGLGGTIDGHAWTIGAWLRHTVRPHEAPPSVPWSVVAEDPRLGPVRLTGRLRHEPSARSLLMIVHGLGGDIDAPYAIAGARAAREAGLSCLRLNLRGADRSGEDFYHAGLTVDLHAALSSEELARYEEVFVLGYSLGGHVTLRYATDAPDPRVAAVAAVSPPLDLDLSALAFDRPGCDVYRRNVLAGLKEIHSAVARRRPQPLASEEVQRIRKIREWDHKIVAPRYGFRSAEHYYQSVSVGHRLSEVSVRSLILFAKNDPMVIAKAVAPSTERCAGKTTVRWIETGGHMAFPAKLDLDYGGTLGLEGQILSWFRGGVD